MYRTRPALPLTRRTEARSLLHADLIAAISRRPLTTTHEYIRTWLDAVASLACRCGPVVFDWFVIGEPNPALLEIAHEVRSVRRAEARGDFDGEEEEWYELHGDDAEPWEPPSVPERVAASLDGRPGFGPIATRFDVQCSIGRVIRIERDHIFDVIGIGRVLEWLVAEVADVCRIGDLVVADGRLRGEGGDGWAWAV